MALIRRLLLRVYALSTLVYGAGFIVVFGVGFITMPPWEQKHRFQIAVIRAALWPGAIIGHAPLRFDPPEARAI